MKRIAIALAVLAAAAVASMGAANAEGVVVGAGPVGVYVGHPWHRHHWRRDYDYARCRVVVRTHINRFGDRVTVRRRICD